MAKHSAPVQTVIDGDAAYRAAWGFTREAWAALGNADRVWYRDHVLSASTVNAR